MLSTLSSWVQLLWRAEQRSVSEEEIEVSDETGTKTAVPMDTDKVKVEDAPAPAPVPISYENKYRAKYEKVANCFVFSEEDVVWEKRQWTQWKNKYDKEGEDEIDSDAFQKIEQAMIARKLNRCMNNWLYENTPAGGLFIRYSHIDEVFEYYSNNTIPYRYLDAAAMRYVVVYGCKPVYVDMNEELERTMQTGYKPTPKPVAWDGKLRDGRKFSLDEYAAWRAKNRTDENSGMISKKGVSGKAKNNGKAQPPSKAKSLKEYANQYVCVGKMCEFQLLQKPPVLDKARTMTYAEYREWKKQTNASM